MSKAYPCLNVKVGDTLTFAFDKVEALCVAQGGDAGFVYSNAAGGDFPLTTVDPGLNVWTTGPTDYTANLQWTVTKTACYKITGMYSVLFDANSAAQVGISINGANPITTNAFHVHTFSDVGGTNVQTVIFYVCLNAGDNIRFMERLTLGTLAEFAPIKMFIERLPTVT